MKPKLLTTLSLLLFSTSIALARVDYTQQNTALEPQFKVEPSHYLDFPVTKKDFQQWQTMGAAVFLKNRAVLAPETRDKKGIMFSTQPNPLMKDWMLDVEVNLGNDKGTKRGGTGLGIFYLKTVDQVSHKESIFGYTNRFEGLGIYMNSILKLEGKGSEGKEYLNAVQGFYNDGTKPVNVFTTKQHICYKHIRNLPEGQNAKIRIQYDSPLITVYVYDIYSQAYEFCFSFEAKLDYNGYFLLSGSSGVHQPDHVFLNSIKLYDPTTIATNDHFQEARHAKAAHEQIAEQIQKGVKDLFENQSNKDAHLKRGGSSNGTMRDVSQFYSLIPQQHNHLTHRLQTIITEHDKSHIRFFETMRGLPNLQTFNDLNIRLFNFRLAVDNLSTLIEQDVKKLRTFEKQIKQVRHTSNVQKGLQQREVTNQHTKQLQLDLESVDDQLQQMAVLIKDYQSTVLSLGIKIQNEKGFIGKLEEQRRQFAQQQSQEMQYDMKEIDDVFNEMELQVVNTGAGWSAMIVNIGMLMVIGFSGFLWCKMKSYESKHA